MGPYDAAKQTMMIFDNQSRIAQDFQKEQRIIFDRINSAKDKS